MCGIKKKKNNKKKITDLVLLRQFEKPFVSVIFFLQTEMYCTPSAKCENPLSHINSVQLAGGTPAMVLCSVRENGARRLQPSLIFLL